MRALARLGCSSCSMDTCGWDSWDPPAFFQARNPWFLLELRPSSVQHGHAVMVLDCKHAAGRKSLAVMRCSLRTDMPWQCQIRLRHPSRYCLHGLFHSWREFWPQPQLTISVSSALLLCLSTLCRVVGSFRNQDPFVCALVLKSS